MVSETVKYYRIFVSKKGTLCIFKLCAIAIIICMCCLLMFLFGYFLQDEIAFTILFLFFVSWWSYFENF